MSMLGVWQEREWCNAYGSYGNGSAMRGSPVGHWFSTIDKVLDAAAATALPSHNHDEGIKGAQTVALAIFKARQFGPNASEHIDDIPPLAFDHEDIMRDAINYYKMRFPQGL